ncbi:MAG: ComEC/Rec2 family competence protein [bacterium]|nr:ComEC/Rec2 family competence protein [bacterium]
MEDKNVHALIFLILIIAIFFRGYFVMHNPSKNALKSDVGKVVNYEGKIYTPPEKKDFLQVFVLETNDGMYIKTGADRFGEYGYGDRVRVEGKLSSPRNFAGKGGRVFDYIDYLGKDSIYYEFKKAKVEVLEKADLNNVPGILFDLKKRFLDNIGHVLGEPHAALAGGLVVGEKTALGKDLLDDFRRSGLIHIVVLSGYNITIIAASIRRMLSFLPRNAGIILGGIGIVLFGILVGGGATVVRSCIMALIALFAEILRRDYDVVRALFIAGALMLIHNPLILLYDPSFQLSFLATLGLVMLSSPIEKKIGFITERFGIRALVASTVATQIFVSPLIFYMMGELSLVGIFVNIAVLPFIPLTMLLVFLAGFFGFIFPWISQVAGWASHIALSYELFVVRSASRLPYAVMTLPAFSGWIVVGFYAFYMALFWKLPSVVSQFIFAKKSSI